jgi:hypothetical protein
VRVADYDLDAPAGVIPGLGTVVAERSRIFWTSKARDGQWSLFETDGRRTRRLASTADPFTCVNYYNRRICNQTGLDLRAAVAGRLLFFHDGTLKATNAKGVRPRPTPLPAVPDFYEGSGRVGDTLLFVRTTPQWSGPLPAPAEVWQTDGTADGTMQLGVLPGIGAHITMAGDRGFLWTGSFPRLGLATFSVRCRPGD